MQAVLRRSGSVARAAIKFLKVLLLVLLYFLLQTALMPHLKIGGIMPNLLMVIIAIMTVSYGKLYAFISGAIVGIILEAMSYSIPLFYLLIYPVLALLCAQVFADMSDIKREMRRIRQAQRQSEAAAQAQASFLKRRRGFRIRRDSPYDLNAHLRILLNTLMLVALFEGVMLIYVALSGISVTYQHILRAVYTAVYSAACCLTMFPVRAFLGLYRRKRPLAEDSGEEVLTTPRELLRSLAIVPDEAPAERKPMFSFLRRKAGPAGRETPGDTEPGRQTDRPEGEVTKHEN